MVVQKIFFTVAGTFVYVYLFLVGAGLVRASARLLARPPGAGRAADRRRRGLLIVLLVRDLLAASCKGLWEKAKQGGAILAPPRDYLVRVVLPVVRRVAAKLGVIAVFLAGYGITSRSTRSCAVIGGNSIANTSRSRRAASGVNQATNVAALNDVTRRRDRDRVLARPAAASPPGTSSSRSSSSSWAFGWTGGKLLVEQSYADAKVKVAEQKAQRAAKKEEKQAAEGE